MTLSYKNFLRNDVLTMLRDVRYSEGQMYFGFYNTVQVEIHLALDCVQLSNQADVFAREMYNLRSYFDFKRFLGQHQDDWLRILHETYVYDRVKNIYYGHNSVNLFEIPKDLFSFPGNVILLNSLKDNNYTFQTGDSQPFSFYGRIKPISDLNDFFAEAKEYYPDVFEGMSTSDRAISFVNPHYESVMKGLHNGKIFLESNKSRMKFSPYQVIQMNDDSIKKFLSVDNNPIFNSFLNDDGNLFYFYLPRSESRPEALRFNESVFLSRAIGFRSKQLTLGMNSFYTVSKRDTQDIFTKDEVHAVTGLKSEMLPYPADQIKLYVNINSFKAMLGEQNFTIYDDEGNDNTTAVP